MCIRDSPKDAAYFHAHYRRVAPLPYGQDYVIADGIQGKGQYVGAFLYVGLNNAGGWWGEGEVKFYMDGDTDFPTICGTGTEDYFGGEMCIRDSFRIPAPTVSSGRGL